MRQTDNVLTRLWSSFCLENGFRGHTDILISDGTRMSLQCTGCLRVTTGWRVKDDGHSEEESTTDAPLMTPGRTDTLGRQSLSTTGRGCLGQRVDDVIDPRD
jgi:hypothetical protein